MGIIVDLIIIGIIVLSTFLAYKKGLVSLAINLFAFIITIVIIFVIYKPVSNLIINTTGIDEAIENMILEKANDVMQENEQNNEVTNQIVNTAKNNMLPETARTLAINIVTGGVIILLYILIKIALRFINALANLVTKLPIIKQFNQLGGLLYGAIRGVILIYVVLLVINVAGQIVPTNSVTQNINKSYIGKTMYEHNILNIFFKS